MEIEKYKSKRGARLKLSNVSTFRSKSADSFYEITMNGYSTLAENNDCERLRLSLVQKII